MKHHIGAVLQKLYDSEINIRPEWMLDGGVEWYILTGYNNDTIIGCGNSVDVDSATNEIAMRACSLYPGSLFEKWYGAAKDAA